MKGKKRNSNEMGVGTGVAYEIVGQHVKKVIEDRTLSEDISKLSLLIESGQLVSQVEQRIGLIR